MLSAFNIDFSLLTPKEKGSSNKIKEVLILIILIVSSNVKLFIAQVVGIKTRPSAQFLLR
jgi:hypothetical protein